jgi:hypothetical protein
MFVTQILHIIVMFVVSYLCFIQFFISVAKHGHEPSKTDTKTIIENLEDDVDQYIFSFGAR